MKNFQELSLEEIITIKGGALEFFDIEDCSKDYIPVSK